MTDLEVQTYLDENGYPQHIVAEGRQGLVRRWREFVEQVESGYPLGLEDYRNDLDVRGILRLADAENAEVLGLDEHFRAILVATDVRVWESGPGEPFWDFGYPRNSGEELTAGLREEGLLAPT
jgi:hypothetical protein